MTTITAELVDRLEIVELVNRLVLLLDSRDWTGLEDVFTDTVYNDRTSLTGGSPETLRATCIRPPGRQMDGVSPGSSSRSNGRPEIKASWSSRLPRASRA
ncbi:MAG TPA: nuclear transport factor 2 family protein [Jatrophihabitans sp.]|nr:nuclear transport factor 2 family protein [Jatrophihabitans sp.]